MTQKKIIIIGAGIAGLCAGSYLQMNGYKTEIFEMHNQPGGLCTSWKRHGYNFDGCIHSLAGTNLKTRMGSFWNELIDMKGMQFRFWEELSQIETEDGKIIHFYTDPEKLRNELLSIAPEDSDFIKKFIKSVKNLMYHDTTMAKPIELWNPLDYYLNQFRTAPYILHLIRWKDRMEFLTKKCHSAILKKVMNNGFFSHYPAYFFVFSVGHLHMKNAGYPIGGSLAFARKIEETYLKLGGKIHYNARVKTINTSENRAIGITLNNGESHNDADLVISAADGYDTIFRMLDGRYLNKKVQKLFSEHIIHPSALLISLGVARTLENEPPILNLCLRTPLVVDDQTRVDELPVSIYNFDPTLAPAGKTCVRVIIDLKSSDYWNTLRNTDRQKYEQEKTRIGNAVIDILDKRFGNIRNKLEAVDVATPATFSRYTHNFQASTQGWDWLPGLIPETLNKQLPGLNNFYMIGQWVMPGGGIPTALITARDVTRIICKKEHKKFHTEKKI